MEIFKGKTEAETARLNGWVVGDIFEGDEGYGIERIRITAIGEEKVLCVWDESGEHNTTFSCREWKKIS